MLLAVLMAEIDQRNFDFKVTGKVIVVNASFGLKMRSTRQGTSLRTGGLTESKRNFLVKILTEFSKS
jgi:hypothetical protein